MAPQSVWGKKSKERIDSYHKYEAKAQREELGKHKVAQLGKLCLHIRIAE